MNMINSAAEMEATTGRLGRVVGVSGSQAIMLVDAPDDGAEAISKPSLQMGQLVKVCVPNLTLFGLVTGLSIPIPRPDDTLRRHGPPAAGACRRRTDGNPTC